MDLLKLSRSSVPNLTIDVQFPSNIDDYSVNIGESNKGIFNQT